MEGEDETYLELYLDQCASQDDLTPAGPPLLHPLVPCDVHIPHPSNSETAFNSHLEVQEASGDFSAMDLSFLPDELTQKNRDQNDIRSKHETEESDKIYSQPKGSLLPDQLPVGLGLTSSNVPDSQCHEHPGDADSVPLSPDKPSFLPLTSITPMTPMNAVSECSGMVPQLQNIVSTVNLACMLDLKKIALHAKNAEYNPKRFAAVIMRIREPRTTALIFGSGKMVCTGAKSEEESRLAARKYARVVQKLGFPARFVDFKIQNMVASCDMRFSIRLEGLVLTHRQFSSYEPELFPGLIYRMVKPRIVLLIFVSGKIVLTGCQGAAIPAALSILKPLIPTSSVQAPYKKWPRIGIWPRISFHILEITSRFGAKERSDIYEAFENIYPILKCFKKS